MKIGILTFFESDNYGTLFQAYALQVYIHSKGHTSEFIHIYRDLQKGKVVYNDIPRKYSIYNKVWSTLVSICHKKDYDMKHKYFNDFRKKLIVSDSYYQSREELINNPPQYDLYLSGGDQIWNPTHKVFSYSYMFDFLDDTAIRASYASSFGVRDVDEETKETMRGHLEKYKYLSVREESGVTILEDMGLDAVSVVDPVFLTQELWYSMKGRSPFKKKYCVIYAISDYLDEEDTAILKYARKNKFEIVILPENRRNKGNFYKKKFSASPEEFINIIANAEHIFTNSFHGVAFSIIFNRQFSVLSNTLIGGKARMIRINNLLASVGIVGNRGIDEINNLLNYDSINGKLRKRLVQSEAYLNQILSI